MSQPRNAGSIFSSTPRIRTFQIDTDVLGNVKKSVNCFRGSVTFPLRILSLTGVNGLSKTVTAVYDSGAASQAKVWNQSAPTGILGLGWTMPVERIIAELNGTGSAADHRYSVVTKTGILELIHTGPSRAADGRPGLEFTTKEYQFWKIFYSPRSLGGDEQWEIVHENGDVYFFGGLSHETDTVQWEIARGNWLGSSSLDTGQQIPIAWNLRQIKNTWGDHIDFSYMMENIPLGQAGGLVYTRASYLAEIALPDGRKVLFDYSDKEFDPPSGISEYLPPHLNSQNENPPAYQDRYETKFLSSLRVQNPGNETHFGIYFGYELINASDDSENGELVKRYLTSLGEINASGESLPGLRMAYDWNDNKAGNRGALVKITYPHGATASYDYALQSLGAASTDRIVDSPGGTPRVWFGEDFAVVTWFQPGQNGGEGQLNIDAYSWAGSWFPWPESSVIHGQFDGDSVRVIARGDFFMLYYTETSGSGTQQVTVNLFQRDATRFGFWQSIPQNPLPLGSTKIPTTAAAGSDFVVVCNKEFSNDPIVAYFRDDNEWQMQTLGADVLGDPDHVAVGGELGYFIACGYSTEESTGSFQLWHYEAAQKQLVQGSVWQIRFDIDFKSVSAEVWSQTFWATGTSFAAATYPTRFDPASEKISYELRVFRWDTDYDVLQDDGEVFPFQAKSSLELPILPSIATGSELGNTENALRFDGESWQATSLDLDTSGKKAVAFGYGSDLLVLTRRDGSAVARRFDPASGEGGAWQDLALSPPEGDATAPPPVNISGDYLCIGRSIYFRGLLSDWKAIEPLPATADPNSVHNAAPELIAFEEGEGGAISTRIALLINGTVTIPEEQTRFDGRRFKVAKESPGTDLASGGMLVTYPSTETFESARSLTLHRLRPRDIRQSPQKYAAVEVVVDDGFQSFTTAYDYQSATATLDTTGEVPQYSQVDLRSGAVPATAGIDSPAPFGKTTLRYYNGLPPFFPGTFYPTNSIEDNFSLFRGMLLSQRGFRVLEDGSFAPEAFRLKDWRVLQETSEGPIPGRYVRQATERRVVDIEDLFSISGTKVEIDKILDDLAANDIPASVRSRFRAAGRALSPTSQVTEEVAGTDWILFDDTNDQIYFLTLQTSGTAITVAGGFSQSTFFEYDLANGRLSRSTRTSFDGLGERQVCINEVTYGCSSSKDGKAIYSGMVEQNVLAPIVQVVKRVNGTAVTQSVTTWKQGWTAKASDAWAPCRSYRALRGDVEFDFAGPPPSNEDWVQTSEVLERSASGRALEALDRDLRTHSVLYDTRGLFVIGTFENASLTQQEALYSGFESYEDLTAWTMTGPVRVTNGNAHTGSSAVELAPTPDTEAGLSINLAPRDPRGLYIVSFFAKTGTGFDGGTDGAFFQVEVSSTESPLTVPITPTDGRWVRLQTTFRIDSPGTQVRLFAHNGSTGASVFLDDIFFAPLLGKARGQIFDPKLGLPTARLQANGHVQRLGYDGAGRLVGHCFSDRTPSALWQRGAARQVHEDVLPRDQPNTRVVLRPGGEGSYDDFKDGEGWQARWQPGASQDWEVSGGALVSPAQAGASLTRRDAAAWTRYGVLVTVSPLEDLTAAVGISLGGRYELRWQPSSHDVVPGSWVLFDLVKEEPALPPRVPKPLFTLGTGSRIELRSGSPPSALVEAFAAHGVLLSADGTRLQDLGGSQWRLTDPQAAQKYLITSRPTGLEVLRLTLARGAWLIRVEDGTIQFFLDGNLIFAATGLAAVTGGPALHAANRVGFSSLFTFTRPSCSLALLDGVARLRQRQLLEGSDLLVGEVLYDPAGRPAIHTKRARFPSTPPGYLTDFVTAVAWDTTGVMKGAVARYYMGQVENGAGRRSNDQGYPYVRRRFEAAPGGLILEEGKPGKDFAINLEVSDRHTSRLSYSASSGQLSLPKGQYRVLQSTDANGVVTSQLVAKKGEAVAKIVQGETANLRTLDITYSDSGRRVVLKHPNAFTPPPGSTPSDWTETHQFDFLGRLIRLQTGTDTVQQYLYDRAGRLRFAQDPNGATAAKPCIHYWKYDLLGRLVEEGVYPAVFDRAALAQKADDPLWPAASKGWFKKMSYDGDGSRPELFGRLTGVEISNLGNAVADVAQSFDYDLCGTVRSLGQRVDAYDGTWYHTGYIYDTQSRVQAVNYPAAHGEKAPVVCYGYDSAGRVATIGTSEQEADDIATYTYNANGRLATENLTLAGGSSISRSFTYNSPGWLAGLSDALLNESTRYVSGGVDGAGFYNGAIAETKVERSWEDAPPEIAKAYDYTPLGFLRTDATRGQEHADVREYDANGNLTQADGVDYRYTAGTNRVDHLGGGTPGSFTYDANGNVTSARTKNIERIVIHPTLDMPTSFTLGSGAADSSMSLLYDGRGGRVLKTTVPAASGDPSTRRLYLRGSTGAVLIEKADGGEGSSPSVYIYGPTGLVAVQNKSGRSAVLKDRLGSTRVLVDATGKAISSYDYDPFGAISRHSGESLTNILFAGQERDPETGLYNFRMRFYDAELGRFYAIDPAGQFPSPYLYAANNPLSVVDPSGALSVWQEILGVVLAVTAVVGVAFTIVTAGAGGPEAAAALAAEGDALAGAEGAAEGAAAAGAAAADSGAAADAGAAAADAGAAAADAGSEVLGDFLDAPSVSIFDTFVEAGDSSEGAGEATEGLWSWLGRGLGSTLRAGVDGLSSVARASTEMVSLGAQSTAAATTDFATGVAEGAGIDGAAVLQGASDAASNAAQAAAEAVQNATGQAAAAARAAADSASGALNTVGNLLGEAQGVVGAGAQRAAGLAADGVQATIRLTRSVVRLTAGIVVATGTAAAAWFLSSLTKD